MIPGLGVSSDRAYDNGQSPGLKHLYGQTNTLSVKISLSLLKIMNSWTIFLLIISIALNG